jgi:alanyl-tRNA synthetase
LHMSERLYHSDSFLRTFTAAVTDLREFTSGNGKLAWQLALDRTAFYPTSGGQPFDTGRLSALARDGAALMVPVEQIEEDEEGTV